VSPPEKDEEPKGKSKRKKSARSAKTRRSKKPEAEKAEADKAAAEGPEEQSKAEGTKAEKARASRVPKSKRKAPAGRAVTVSRETLVARMTDARRTGLVVLAFRAVGGLVITLMLSMIVGSVFYLLSSSGLLFSLVSLGIAAALVVAARLVSGRSIPEAASKLAFLADHAFVWQDPFREERPHLLPLWLEVVLWAPKQVLAGAVPFINVRRTGPADCEAAADVARRMVEEGEIDLTEGVEPESAEAKGLRLLFLVRLARINADGGELKARVSGLGQAALFEGTVG
jgi:hypothetical protein